MKILFCLPGGTWAGPSREPVRTLAKALETSGACQIETICFRPDITGVVRDGTHISVPCRSSLSRSVLGGFRPERRAMAEQIRSASPDLVHVHWTQLGHGLAAMDSGLPYVVTAHDAAVVCAYWNWRWSPGPAIVGLGGLINTRRVLGKARRVIAVSPYVRDHLLDFAWAWGGSDARQRVCMVPNPVERPAPTTKTPRGHGSPVFACVGSWGRLKNFALAIRAFHSFRREYPRARLLLIGGGLESRGPCHKWCLANRVADGVEFLGTLEHEKVLDLLSGQVDCLLHPSRSEGFGLVAMEAALRGIPALVSRRGALPWLAGFSDGIRVVSSNAATTWHNEMRAAVQRTGGEASINRSVSVPKDLECATVASAHLDLYRRVLREQRHAGEGS